MVILPLALNRFLFAKLAVAAAAAALVWLLPPRGRLPRLFLALLAAAAAVLLLATLLGDQPLAQLLGRGPRYEGLLVLPVYALTVVVGSRLLGPAATRSEVTLFVRVLTVAAGVVAVLALLETTGLEPLSSTSARPGSLLGNASDQGVWALLALGPLAAQWLRTGDRWAMFGTVAAGVGIVTSASRGALLGAAVALVILLLMSRERRQRMTLGAAIGIGALLALLLPGVRGRLLGSDPLAAATVGGRGQLWDESWDLITSRPLLGTGPSGFVDAIVTEHTPEWYRTVGPAFPPDSPHSWPLQALSAGGPPLLLLALALAGLIVIAAIRARRADGGLSLRTGAAAAVIAYGVALLFHFTSAGPMMLAGLLVGLVLAIPPDSAKPAAVVAGRWAAAATACLALVLAAAALAEIPLRQAITDLQSGQTEAAEGDFRAAAWLRPWDAEVAGIAGHAYAVLATAGDQAAAEQANPWLDRAAARLPLSVGVLVDRAAIAEADGDLARAEALLLEALDRDPFNPDLWLTIGVVQAQAEEFEAAEQSFLSAADYAPDSPDPWQNLARLYELQGDAGAAAAAREEAARQS